MPLLNYEIIYNKRIKTQQTNLQKIELEVYKRELVKDIKIAYYKYLQSVEGITIYENALSIVKENQRINRSLFKNEKINRTAVLRSDNEVKRIEANLEVAKNTSKNARSYFNFLLNRKLDSEIEIDENMELPTELTTENITGREELKQLYQAKEINDNVFQMTRSNWFPKLSGFADLGFQDFDFKVDKSSRYYFAGLSLEWNIFSGNKNKYKLKQVDEDQKKISSQIDNVKQQLLLQYEVSQKQRSVTKNKLNTKKSSDISYMEQFLTHHTMTKRGDKSIYIRPEYHERLSRIIQIIADDQIPLYAYLDNILAYHFEMFEKEITDDFNKKYRPIF